MRILGSFFLLLGLLVAQFGYGKFILSKFKSASGFESSNGLATKSALGQVFTGAVFTIFALISSLNVYAVLSLVIPGLVLSCKPRIMFSKFSFTSLRPTIFRNPESFFWGGVFLLFLIGQTLRVLSRPVSDGLAYYLAQPKIIAHSHQLIDLIGYSPFLQSSSLVEVNNAAAYLLSGEIGLRFYLLSSGLLLVKSVVEICKLIGMSMNSIKIIILLVVTSTFITNTMADGKTDNVSALWFMAAFWVLILALKSNHKWLFLLSGAFITSSILSKISYAILIPPLFWFSWWYFRGNNLKRLSRSGLYFGIGSLLTFFLNSVKNLIAFGEPLAPFHFFKTQSGTEFFSQSWFSAENTKWILLSYPIALFFGKYPMQYGNLSPFAFLAIPLAFGNWLRPRIKITTIQSLGIMGLLGICSWVMLKPSVLAPRYITPAFIFLYILIAQISSKNLQRIKSRIGRIIFYTVVSFSFILTLSQSWISNDLSYYRPAFGAEKQLYSEVSKSSQHKGLIYLNTYNSSMLADTALACSSAIHPFTPGKYENTDPEIWLQLKNQGFRYVISDESTHLPMSNLPTTGNKVSTINEVVSVRYSENLVSYEIRTSEEAGVSLKKGCG
jgi:hypothetical protein